MLKSADSAKLPPKRRTDHTSQIEIEQHCIGRSISTLHPGSTKIRRPSIGYTFRLKCARMVFTTLGEMSRLDCERDDEHLLHHRALDENPRQICRPTPGVERRSRCRR